MLSERDIIALLGRAFPHRAALTELDIGDDTTLLAGDYRLVTVDLMVHGVHFDLGWMDMADVSYRALAANLSDIAAMGGVPGPFVLGLGVPPRGARSKEVEGLAAGFRACLDDHGATESWLVGGDVVRSPGGWMLSLTLFGRPAGGAPLTRGGARSGDHVVVFRPLGDGAAGLVALASGHAGRWPELELAHRRPRVDVGLGQRLGAWGQVRALMDLSDGLAQDLPRLVGPTVGVQIDVSSIPTSPVMQEAAAVLGRQPWELACCGGEDYSLCAVVAPEHLDALATVAAPMRPTVIGDITPGSRVSFMLDGRDLDLEGRGFTHFESAGEPSGGPPSESPNHPTESTPPSQDDAQA